MRADRLISILIMLKQRGKMTAGELAEALEVSERTIHRDMEALCSAGLPVVAERGKTGGWRLVDHWPHQLSWLKINEMKSLFIPHSDHLLADLGLEEASIKARAKLLASVPGTFRQDAKILGERIYIDLRTWRDSAEKIRSFQVIQQAVWECRKLRMTYKTSDGQTNPRTIEPLGLVFKSSHWYLVAKRDEEFRTYRASRIQSAALLEETFARPEDFNLKEYWMKSKARFIKKIPQYKVEAEISPAIKDRMKFTDRFVQILKAEPLENEWMACTLCFESETEAVEHILSFGNQIKVISPNVLREKVIRQAESIIHIYENDIL